MKRFLVTTADERSWKWDRPVLFLGEWCRHYHRRHVWSKMDAIVAKPYGLEAGQKWRDLERVQAVAGKLLTELTQALNRFHQAQHNERYWNIVLGHWLERYVAVAFNRFHALDQALSTHEVDGSAIIEAGHYRLATPDSGRFILACNADDWNHVLYSRLLAYRGDVELTPIPTPLQKQLAAQRPGDQPVERRVSIRRTLLSFASGMSRKLARTTDALIIDSYLPRIEEIKLQVALGQVPQLWRSASLDPVAPDAGQRGELALDHDLFTGFERYVRWQLPELIPTCYLEGYRSLLKVTEALPWPAKPRFIFTSNAFDVDDVFKVWTATKVERGVPYFTGQHGNNYGTLLGTPNWPERVAADRFFTWGSNDEGGKTVSAFVFTTMSQKPGRFDPAGGLVLMELHLPDRLDPADSYYEFGLYQEDQFRFVERLPGHIQGELTVRLHPASQTVAWFDEQRWKDRNPNTRLDSGSTPVRQLIARSRLVVHSYDSTGILECLSLSIPSICFWRGELDHVLPDAKPYYEQLQRAGILFGTPEEAADHVGAHWQNISGWWGSREVQDARLTFSERYARRTRRPIRMLSDLLMRSATECRRSQSLGRHSPRLVQVHKNVHFVVDPAHAEHVSDVGISEQQLE